MRTPLPVANAHGLAALAYRVGRHGDFLSSMLARLASIQADPPVDPAGGGYGAILRGQSVPPGIPPEFPLTALTVRTTDDPAIALLDAWAVVLDVLTFYQERIANEGFLRTATEFRSVQELARLVGYAPRPGVAASAYLAYGVEKNTQLILPRGSRSTSTPGPGELPQTFETSTDLDARGRWTALVARKGRPQAFEPGQTTAGRRVWFEGLTTQLKPNDPLLLVFDGASGQPFRVRSATPDNSSQTTRVVLQDFSSKPLLKDADAVTAAKKQFDAAIHAYEQAGDEQQMAFARLASALQSVFAQLKTAYSQAADDPIRISAIQHAIDAFQVTRVGLFKATVVSSDAA
jgi:hypothetical protein